MVATWEQREHVVKNTKKKYKRWWHGCINWLCHAYDSTKGWSVVPVTIIMVIEPKKAVENNFILKIKIYDKLKYQLVKIVPIEDGK